ncbi:F-box protein SKIP28 [Lactuca sativa]|uniref:F-box domain-containing protein n=1 Tax=Lactuca sativa TaxID=4236 RepID=A0A9R1XJV6_LACSA|nr:F-box protein SKIP28 [Lactuca sativa]KAJ0212539.1 hypothetical protein LSAT_V11C400162400 [Lactuca sativa]
MDMEISHETNHKQHQINQDSSNTGQPHESLYLVLPYLPLFELLAMAQVCKSFNNALKDDILPWLNIIVDENHQRSRISDEILVKIASKAMGRLRTLVLSNCDRVTNDGVQTVVAMNPNIEKLHVPQCTNLTPEGIIQAVTTLNQHVATLKSLKINGIYNITKDHFQTLCMLMKSNEPDTSRQDSIDVGICPKCDEVRMVFDCPLETCERKNTIGGCRGCKFCILRCEECGKCVEEDSEAACEDTLCLDCWIKLPKCGFCNKPYCNKHAYKQCVLPDSSGFVCEACYSTIDEI